MIRLATSRKLASLVSGIALAILMFVSLTGEVAAAACTPPSTDYGTATTTVNIPATGTYQILSRLKADSTDNNNNSYFLEIDGDTCIVIGDNTAISQDDWTWVNYQDGNTGSQAVHNFTTTGNHTIKMIGREPNVSLDRVIFTQDLSCTPTGTGDNCADPPDTTAPAVSLTAPSDGATVNGQVTVSADASDAESGIEKVEFRVDGNIVNEDTAAPYSFNWDTAALANGTYSVSARAYNNEGLDAISGTATVTVDNPAAADLVVTDISYTPADPTAGTDVTFTAMVENQGGTATQDGTIVGVRFSVDGEVVAWSDDSTDALEPGASRELTANGGPSGGTGAWTATAGTFTVTAEVDDVDRISESNEDNNTSSINLTISEGTPPADTTPPSVSVTSPSDGATIDGTVTVAADASDDVGVARVEFYVDNDLVGGPDSTVPYSVALDTTTLTNGTHALTAKAFDQAGNETTSNEVNVTVDNEQARAEDINEDGTVNLLDFSLLASRFGQSGGDIGRADINGDGTVNLLDFSLLAARYGE